MEQKFVEHQPHLPGFIPHLPIKDLPPDLIDEELCEELADRLAKETNQELPVDIEEIAQFCGVAKITDVLKLRAQGFLHHIGETDYYHMELRSEDDPVEKRFTTAHEIGHLFLRALGREWTSKPLQNNNPIERFCDRFARAVLAPRSLLEEEVKILNQANQEELWRDHNDWFPITKAITNELWQLLQATELPPPYLAQRLAEDLGLSSKTLMSITIGPQRKQRNTTDHVYWRNIPFQLNHPRLQSDEKDLDSEDGLVDDVSAHFTNEMYHRYLKQLEASRQSYVVERVAELGVTNLDRWSWLDIYETKMKGLLICQDGIASYFLAALNFDNVATVQASSERYFPYQYFYQHLIKLLPKYRSDGRGYIFE